MIAVVAEKPSVARDIARALGAHKTGPGYLQGGGYVVTWSIGHLVALAEPHEIHPEWKTWRRDALPMLPQKWPLMVMDATRSQYDVIARILNDERVEKVIAATDAGREGEHIFRLIYELSGSRKPVERLWISSLTPEAIARGFRSLRPSRDFDALADAARGRAQADWLVGMNLSRAYTIGSDELYSVGRVQTPTLAMVVDREKEIRDFVPEKYCEVAATFSPTGADAPYIGRWFKKKDRERDHRLPGDGVEAGQIVKRVATLGRGEIESLERTTRKMPPPLLYDLTELQRHANRLYGYSAQKTLDLAQKLYETRKLLTYPRTDSRHLSNDVASQLPAVVAAIAPLYDGSVAEGTGRVPLSSRYVDDAKVSDHHAIIPTALDPAHVSLPDDERHIYDLVCRRLLSAWHKDQVSSVTTIVTRVGEDPFLTTGTMILDPGWKVLDVVTRRTEEEPVLPAILAEGTAVSVREVKAEEKETRPPKRYTEATLLTAMENSGRDLDDKELSRAMKDCGLGTPATRASMIETLVAREYIVREGKMLRATEKGIRLIDRVHPMVKSAAMTGEWEAKLAAIQRGEAGLAAFMRQIEDYVREVVGGALGGSPSPSHPPSPRHPSPPPRPSSPPPRDELPPLPLFAPRSRDLAELLKETFHHERFRPHQEAVCRAASEGHDVLLVMPTGAGKSLCYQLPGLARGGTTLVVSPLIALIEDQVGKLRQLGLRAERIHSGRPRADSRAVCRAYLNGELDFLFIAPERLAVPGFPELLAKRRPTLVAIDEAHCISQWGHDFRPEYRMLGQRIRELRPAPVIALTATATRNVQNDIAEQLGVQGAKRFIHGFRRTNIAIESVEVSKPERARVVRALLKDRERRPAIIYSPTRAEAQELATALNSDYGVAAYHAGMNSEARDSVQSRFISGELQVVVATIAFGMGIDKANVRTVVHTALPQTLEGYYQEIGRAGRDGAPSRAVLLHSFADRKMLDFFLENNYPPVPVLARIFEGLGADPIPKYALRERLRISDDTFDRALEKLWVHGGALIDPDESMTRGAAGWERSYQAQRDHRARQAEDIARFAQAHGCRMLHVIGHFGDETDPGTPCGICDACAHGGIVVQSYRNADEIETGRLARIVELLGRGGPTSTGTVFRECFGENTIERRTFEDYLSGLARAGLVKIEEDEFVKDGRRIAFQKVRLTPQGRAADAGSFNEIQIAKRIESGALGGKKSGKSRKRTEAAKRAIDEARADAPTELVEALRAWRLHEAKKRNVPAFRIMSDRVLYGLASERPANRGQMEEINGVGPKLSEKYGKQLLELLADPSRAVAYAEVAESRSRRR
jgi:DNA topoisomerase-3